MTDLSELFARDPLTLTNPDIDRIIEQMRAARHQFNAGNMKAGSTKAPTEKQKQVSDLADRIGELKL